MQWTRKGAALAAANIVCLAISSVIAYHAVNDWPVRYRLHTLSWSATTYFVVFMTLSVLGPIVAGAAWRLRKYPTMYRAASVPVACLALGVGMGVLKILATHHHP
jgi:uncharacterized membrane protein